MPIDTPSPSMTTAMAFFNAVHAIATYVPSAKVAESVLNELVVTNQILRGAMNRDKPSDLLRRGAVDLDRMEGEMRQ